MIIAKVVSAPTSEPLSLLECYHHLRLDPIDSSDITGRPDDALIEALISAAREYCENFTGLSLALKDYEVRLDAFPDEIELPHPPFVALLNGITITDEVSDNAIDEDLYAVDDFSDLLAVISPVSSWPTLATGNTVRVRYRAGFGDESEAFGQVPGTIRAAMLLLVGHWYANREAVGDAQMASIPLGVESLLRPHRVRLGMA